jgi:hypothetical protein
MADDEPKALVASLAVAQDRTDEKIKATNERMKGADEKLECIGVRSGNVTNNQGDVAEEFFFQSLINIYAGFWCPLSIVAEQHKLYP